MDNSTAPKNDKWDLWRDSPVRYLGYANEVGEALAPVYRKVLLPSYAVSIAYVLGDTYDKTLQAYRHQLSGRVSECDSGSGSGGSVSGSTSLVTKPSVASVDYSRIAVEAGDTLLWQMLASVTLPGLTIKGVAHLAGKFINHEKIKVSITKTGRLYFPTAIGLATIPFIIQPIDALVDGLMDKTYRPYFNFHKDE